MKTAKLFIVFTALAILTAGCQKIYMGSTGVIPRSTRPFTRQYEQITFCQEAEGMIVHLYFHGYVEARLQYGQSITVELPVGRTSIGIQRYQDGRYFHGLFRYEVPAKPINPMVHMTKAWLRNHAQDWGPWEGW